MTQWLESAIARIQSLAALKENWDSYGAAPPAPSAIGHAVEMLRRLAEGSLMSAPYICPTRVGGVQFEWNGVDKSLEIEIYPSGECEYLLEYERTQAEISCTGKWEDLLPELGQIEGLLERR